MHWCLFSVFVFRYNVSCIGVCVRCLFFIALHSCMIHTLVYVLRCLFCNAWRLGVAGIVCEQVDQAEKICVGKKKGLAFRCLDDSHVKVSKVICMVCVFLFMLLLLHATGEAESQREREEAWGHPEPATEKPWRLHTGSLSGRMGISNTDWGRRIRLLD